LLDDPFGAFYPVLAVIAFGWQELRGQLRIKAAQPISLNEPLVNVRFGSQADIAVSGTDVRFTPESGL
jgi:hypothetical protein